MNFKDAYRAANEEIHGDRSILAGITEEKPKKIIYFKPALGTAVAAAVCLVTLMVYPYIGFSPSDKETPHQSTEDVMIASEPTESMAVPDTFSLKRTATAPTEQKAEKEAYNYSADISEDLSAKSTADAGAGNANFKAMTADDEAETEAEAEQVYNTAAETDAVYATTEDAAPQMPEYMADTSAAPQMSAEEIMTDRETASAGGGGGGSSAAVAYSVVVSVTADSITVTHPVRGEITLKISGNTVITDAFGAILTTDALQTGASVELVEAEETAVKIIIK